MRFRKISKICFNGIKKLAIGLASVDILTIQMFLQELLCILINASIFSADLSGQERKSIMSWQRLLKKV